MADATAKGRFVWHELITPNAAGAHEFYSKAVRLAEKNYKIQLHEYSLGLINNIQVLDVLTDLQDLRIRKIRVEALTRLNDIKLRVATGQGLK